VTVARREYFERVRSKAFIVSTFVGPLVLVGLMAGPGLLMNRQRGKPLRVEVIDATGALRPSVEGALARRETDGALRFVVVPSPGGSPEQARAAARQAIIDGRLDAYLYLPPDAVASSLAEYYGKNVSNRTDVRLVEAAAEEAVVAQRLSGEGLDAARVKTLTRGLDLKTIRLTAGGEREDRGQSVMLSLILLSILYTTVAMWGAAIMNGVIEEKTNRVVEVIVSSIPTADLFAGKLVGIGAAGLTQFLVWAATLAAFGLFGAALAGPMAIPETPPLLLASFVLFFLLGFFLYGSLYAAIGSAVNTQQEAQSLAFPVMLPLILSFTMFPGVLHSPDGNLSVALSMVPVFTPLLMFLRITVLPPPPWQIALSVVLTSATIAFVTWGSSRVYRVGILMYGKRPTFPEILRWARRS
jgi:ABC-2 type transport system permease protein